MSSICTPNYIWLRAVIARNLTAQYQLAEAATEVRQALQINRHDSSLSELIYLESRRGQTIEARPLLAELEAQLRRRLVSPVYLARAYIGLGNKQRALISIEQAYLAHSDHLLSINISPAYESLRGDPRLLISRGALALRIKNSS